MKFHVTFSLSSQDRDQVFRKLQTGALESESSVRLVSAWVAAQGGLGFAVVETDDAAALYRLCSTWNDAGDLDVIPVVSADEL